MKAKASAPSKSAIGKEPSESASGKQPMSPREEDPLKLSQQASAGANVVDVIDGPSWTRSGSQMYTCRVFVQGENCLRNEIRLYEDIDKSLITEYEERAKEQGKIRTTRRLRENVKTPERFADVGRRPRQERKVKRTKPNVEIDLTDPKDPLSVLRTCEKNDLLSAVGSHMLSSSNADTEKALAECTKRLDMEDSCQFFEIAKLAYKEEQLKKNRQALTKMYCGLRPFVGIHSSPVHFYASKYILSFTHALNIESINPSYPYNLKYRYSFYHRRKHGSADDAFQIVHGGRNVIPHNLQKRFGAGSCWEIVFV